MATESSKRDYCSKLEFVESGFRACWRNAKDLLSASQKLIDCGLHAPALSLSVLALEEVGKLFAIDGLLYAKLNDYKSAAFIRSGRSHTFKLTSLEMFPLLLGNLAMADPRYGTEQRFNEALASSIRDLKDAGNTVADELGDGNFLRLDEMNGSNKDSMLDPLKKRNALSHLLRQSVRPLRKLSIA